MNNLEKRFLLARTIPGTHSLNYFVSLSLNSIGTKGITAYEYFCLIFNLSGKDLGESGNEWANLWFLMFVMFSNNCFGSELVLQLLYSFGYIKES